MDVVVYRLTIEATVEQRIFALQTQKRELANAALEGKAIAKLTMNELLNLFKHDTEHYTKGTKLGDFMLGQGSGPSENMNAAPSVGGSNTVESRPRIQGQTKLSSRPEHAVYGRRW